MNWFRPLLMMFYAPTRGMSEAISRFADDVRAGAYPGTNESYPLPADAAAELQAEPIAPSDDTEVEQK